MVEMQQDRKGFLETRIFKWNQVIENKDKFDKKANKLVGKVDVFKDKKNNLETDLREECN